MEKGSEAAGVGYSIGVDIGGTFTDLILVAADGRVFSGKRISTPPDYERGIAEGLRELLARHRLDPAGCKCIVHGTTAATNAIIERKGARTGLLTTRGFRDVLELRRIRVPKLYDLTWEKPVPLVERYLRTEASERIDKDGKVLTPLDRDSVLASLKAMQDRGIQSLAICFINSYANPEHERQAREIIAGAAPDLPVTISSDILPEMREYERTSTTVINAYVMPVIRTYAARLQKVLAELGFKVPLLLMQSNGGLIPADMAAERPITIIESGPAAGVVGSDHLMRRLGGGNAVSLDIGGTTAKASLIEDGQVHYAAEYEVGGGFTRSGSFGHGGGYVLRAPTIDISEIGAGGGSIVWLDGGGALRVGPQSAGAEPGPVCYSHGGTEPTLTDACLALGYLDPAGLAGGSVMLDRPAAEAALRVIADRLGVDPVDFAFGVFRIAVSAMGRAIRSVSVERGKDPRDFDLIAFGGNGGLFAASVARDLELKRVIIPPAAGIFSALGMLYPDLEHHSKQTVLGRLDALDPAYVGERWRALETAANRTLESEGFGPKQRQLQRFGELRYVSQTHEIAVPWPAGESDAAAFAKVAERFEEAHEQTYGHRAADAMIELVNLHLVAKGVSGEARLPAELRYVSEQRSGPAERPAFFGQEAGWRGTALLSRGDLTETPRRGPLIIQEFDTTILVPPDFAASVDRLSNVILQRSEAAVRASRAAAARPRVAEPVET